MEEEKASAAQTRVRFTTKYAKYQVPSTPFSVPQRINRLGLNEIINHLLSNDEPVQFEFLIEGQLLRTSLKKALKRTGLSEETVIDIEYVPAAQKPNPKGAAQFPDWVGDVAFWGSTVISACYDGSLHATSTSDLLASESPKDLWVVDAHRKPIVSIHQHNNVLVAGSQDYRTSVWELDAAEKSVAPSCVASLQTASPVQSVLLCSNDTLALAGTWNGSVFVWNPWTAEGDVDMEEPTTRASKRQRAPAHAGTVSEPPVVSYKDALYDLEEHKQAVSSMCLVGGEGKATTVATGSWDHSIKVWDIDRAGSPSTRTLIGNKVVTSVTSHNASTIVSGHTDHIIRSWDLRQSSSNPAQVFKGVKSWISDVAWAGDSDTLFLSASHDGSVAVWDVRGKECLYNFPAHDGKALCVESSTDGVIASGGSDCKVKVFESTFNIDSENQTSKLSHFDSSITGVVYFLA